MFLFYVIAVDCGRLSEKLSDKLAIIMMPGVFILLLIVVLFTIISFDFSKTG